MIMHFDFLHMEDECEDTDSAEYAELNDTGHLNNASASRIRLDW